MLKEKFSEESEVMIPLTDIVDNEMDVYQSIRHQMERYFTSNKLDLAIIKHLYGMMFCSVFREHGYNNNVTIRDVINHYCRIDSDMGKSVASLFKGVNKSIIAPDILVKGALGKDNHEATETLEDDLGATSVVSLHPDDILKLNPKNLRKVYGYSELDAKAIFRGVNVDELDLYIPKKRTYSENMNHLAIYNFSEPAMFCWHINGIMDLDELDKQDMSQEVSAAVLEKLFLDTPLPITNLSLWRLITQDWYEREKGRDWHKLSSLAQKRHLVNMIRHGSIGYSQCYTNLSRDLADLLHEAAFNRIMRQISNTFPFLHTECQRQWDYRDENGLTWRAIDQDN